MAARGSVVKEEIKNKILEVFPGSFLYNGGKEIRIPMSEEGELIQIKCTLTAAKVNVDCEGGADVYSAGSVATSSTAPVSPGFMNEPSTEEKKAVEDLLSALGLS